MVSFSLLSTIRLDPMLGILCLFLKEDAILGLIVLVSKGLYKRGLNSSYSLSCSASKRMQSTEGTGFDIHEISSDTIAVGRAPRTLKRGQAQGSQIEKSN